VKARIAITAVLTMFVLTKMYFCRPITFAIWTLSAQIDRRFPLVTVTVLEAGIAALVAAVVWAVSGQGYRIWKNFQ
jgi:hypothetical protein